MFVMIDKWQEFQIWMGFKLLFQIVNRKTEQNKKQCFIKFQGKQNKHCELTTRLAYTRYAKQHEVPNKKALLYMFCIFEIKSQHSQQLILYMKQPYCATDIQDPKLKIKPLFMDT